jgi:ATP/maltotriose-dependent transcriptional regulator MalT
LILKLKKDIQSIYHLLFGEMYTILLDTKFIAPPPVKNLVVPSRSLDKLNNALQPTCRLAHIAELAGFGKTTLHIAWITGCGKRVAWLPLVESDNLALISFIRIDQGFDIHN